MANGHILFTSNEQKLRTIVAIGEMATISIKGQICDSPTAKIIVSLKTQFSNIFHLSAGLHRNVGRAISIPSETILKNKLQTCIQYSYVVQSYWKAIVSRLNAHLANNHLNETFQSAYRAMHSTETALLKVKVDILCALDQRAGFCCTSTSVQHLTLLTIASFETGFLTFCIKGTALQWFSSYLQGQRNRVTVYGSYSLEHKWILDF